MNTNDTTLGNMQPGSLIWNPPMASGACSVSKLLRRNGWYQDEDACWCLDESRIVVNSEQEALTLQIQRASSNSKLC